MLLIWLMVKKNSMPSYVALPITAALIYAIKLFILATTPCCSMQQPRPVSSLP
ncbi:L-lactate permease [Neisseria flavescens]|nr:L-lactate permease [Neisseria flavescens]